MVPRVDIVAVEAGTPLPEAADVVLRKGHSRIPVYEGSIDNVIGMLHAKDLLVYLKDGRTDVPLRSILRKAYFVPETKRVSDLLEELQQRRIQAAIVVDEYGGTAGLVTIEDLVEEIVGEIEDEYDIAEEVVERTGPNEFVVDGRLPVDDLSRLVGVTLPSEGADTVGGLILAHLGRIPAVGDQLQLDRVGLCVLSVSGRRVGKARVRVLESASDEGPTCPAVPEEATQEAGTNRSSDVG
jgi:CBS domain containing-hemolysin-like protein